MCRPKLGRGDAMIEDHEKRLNAPEEESDEAMREYGRQLAMDM